MDGIFNVKLAVQTLHEFDTDVFLIFIDLVKACDSINRELLFIMLDKAGLPSSLTSTIKKLCRDVKIFI